MSSPGWARGLLRRLAPADRQDEVLGDLEEAHRARLRRHGRIVATLLTILEALDMGLALLRLRLRRRRPVDSLSAAGRAEATSGGPRLPLPSWLDFKLGLRMLLRYPGLTVVAGLAMAFAIAIGAGSFEFVTDLLYPRIPLDEGDRLVEIWHRDLGTGNSERPSPHDLVTWQAELRAVGEIGATVSFERNVSVPGGDTRTLRGAELTAGAFRMARVAPLMGRLLLEADEEPGAASVVVIGHEAWRTLFRADPGVVGRTVLLGTEPTTVVGVMPEGFGYPRAHDLWTPLRFDPAELQAGEGPPIVVVARLAPGVTMDEARTELAGLGRRASLRFPDTHGDLRPELTRYGRIPEIVVGVDMLAFFSLNVAFFALLMLLVCGNVALLLFARTAARESELVVRSALGASRRRIVTQLAAEALVLGGVAAAVGLRAAGVGLPWVLDLLRQGQGMDSVLGFWFDTGLAPGTVAYALAFTAAAAIAAGAVPALRVTGHGVQPRLQRSRAGGSGLEVGRLWSAVIVTQVAVTVAFVPIVIILGVQTLQIRDFDPGFSAEQYLSVRVEDGRTRAGVIQFEAPRRADGDAFASAYRELERRIAEEPGAAAVTVARNVPGEYHGWQWIELNAAAAPSGASWRRVESTAVDPDFFDVLGARIVTGRGFDALDVEAGAPVVVVNEDFVRVVLEGRNPVGRRVAFVRRVSEELPDSIVRSWQEIVGVVEQISMTLGPDRVHGAGIYGLLDPADPDPVRIIARVAGADPMALAPRVRDLARDVDPTLVLEDMRPASEAAWQTELAYTSWFWVVLVAGGITLLLATAGIYSVMSFTVSRRTREIGIRVALGADARRVVSGIFSRAFRQIGIGITAGGVLFVAFVFAVSEPPFHVGLKDLGFMIGYLAAMTGVCLLACLVPTRRALRIEPTEALRWE